MSEFNTIKNSPNPAAQDHTRLDSLANVELLEAQKSKDSLKIAQLLYYKSFISIHADSTELAIKQSSKGIDYLQNKDTLLYSQLIANLASSYFYLNNRDSSIFYDSLNLTYLTKLGVVDDFAHYCARLATTYQWNGNHKEAKSLLFTSIEYLKENQASQYDIHKLYLLLSNIYLSEEDFESAIGAAKKAADFFNSLEKKTFYSLNSMQNLAYALHQNNQIDSALNCYQSAFYISKNLQSPTSSNRALYGLALIHYELHDLESSSEYMNLILNSETIKKDRRLYNRVEVLHAKILMDKNESKSALQILEGIESNLDNDLSSQPEFYKTKSKCHQILGENRKALHDFQQYKLVDDSLKKNYRDAKYTRLQTELKVEQIENEKVILRAELAESSLAEEKANSEIRGYIAGIAIMTFALVFCGFIIYSIRKNKTLQKALDQTTIEALKKRVVESSKLMGMMQLKLNESTNLDDKIPSLIESIQKDHNLTATLPQFEAIFPNFNNKLKSINPDITMTELKYCMLIRLNFSNKEIAQILYVNPNSVKKARNRIKKRLKIESEDLNSFILNIE
jgi:tetratricopeptide (TPR) repeat protein